MKMLPDFFATKDPLKVMSLQGARKGESPHAGLPRPSGMGK